MTIRTKFLLSQAALAVCILAIVAVVTLALQLSNRNRTQLQHSYEQLQAITTLSLAANSYFEQVTDLFILGEVSAPGFEQAERRLTETLNVIMALVRDKEGVATRGTEAAYDDEEVDRYARIRDAISELKRSVERRVDLRRDRPLGAAVQHRQDEIEYRIDVGLDRLIVAALADEREEVAAALAYSAWLGRASAQLVIAVALLTGAAGLAVAFLLYRMVGPPIARLVEGADAVGRGEFAHRVMHVGSDELAHLSARFNAMTCALDEHRTRLLRAQVTLEEKVRERTAELHTRGQQLEAANARLEEADRSRVRFLADISHEFRTPLTVLRGEAEVALRAAGIPPGDERCALIRIVQKTEEMGRLVDDLLFLARSEAGTVVFHNEPCLLNELVSEALRDANMLSAQRGVRIASFLPLSAITASCDQNRLKQALLIVIDNAIKYSPSGAMIRVELSHQDGSAAIRVINKGAGLTEEEVAHAFDRFYRGRNARSGKTRGSGLGLPIAKWIVERQGGTIDLASGPEGGAAVTMRLPDAVCEEDVAE